MLGLGATGSLVVQRLHGHGMHVRAIRRDLKNVPPCVEGVFGLDRLPEIFKESDFLIIGFPASDALMGRSPYAIRNLRASL